MMDGRESVGGEQYFLAIDAGGTKTDLLLADATRELARVRTGSIKLLNTPPEIAEEHLVQALVEIEQISGIAAARITRTCIGTSGYSVPLVADWIREQFQWRTRGELLLCGDEEIALDAAFEGRRGILALAGTGSNVVGRTAAGRMARAGGWGPVLADEGSGHWIGLQAIRAALRARDEGRPTELLDAVLRTWKLAELRELIQLGNASSRPPFANLTPAVAECAERGDEVAAEVLELGGAEMARLVGLVIDGIARIEGEAAGVPEVALAGSILQSVAPVRESMVTALRRRWPEITVLLTSVDPVQGALWRARTTMTSPTSA